MKGGAAATQSSAEILPDRALQIKLHDAIISARDASEQFGHSVNNAIIYYEKNAVECVKILSNSKQRWFVNSLEKPTLFYGILLLQRQQPPPHELPTLISQSLNKDIQKKLHDAIISARDASNQFGHSVTNAIIYYGKNAAECVKIFSNSKQQWFVNSLEKPKIFYPILFLKYVSPHVSQAPLSQLAVAQASLLKNKLFVFDFDNTLTSFHTGGVPETEKTYFNVEQLQSITNMFKSIEHNFPGSIIVILSRGYTELIKKYMFDKFPMLFRYLNEIIGADLKKDIQKDSEEHWAEWKASKLIDLCMKYEMNKDDIVFFDDTKININVAQINGFKESYLVLHSNVTNTTNVESVFNSYLQKVQSVPMRGGKYYMTSKEKKIQ